MLKVAKFGGSSMADAGQYRKVRDIILPKALPYGRAFFASLQCGCNSCVFLL